MPLARSLSISVASLILLIAAACGMSVQAANPTDLSGRAYNITITAEGGDQKDRLVFSTKDLSAKNLLGDSKLPYTFKMKGKSITFTATQTGSDGSVMTIDGTISGDNVTGSISFTPKGGTAKSLNYTSVKPKT